MPIRTLRALTAFLALALLSAPHAAAQKAEPLPQHDMAKWGVRPAGYSGIAPLGNGRYAVVSDNEAEDGFFVFAIEQDSVTGDITNVRNEGFRANPHAATAVSGRSPRDCEGVAFFPSAQTVFISGEGDQQIMEYDLQGNPTGRGLDVPEVFSLPRIVPNYGFEALAYCPETRLFWTTTESTLQRDGRPVSASNPGAANLLRLQSFGDDLRPAAQYAYKTERGRDKAFGKIYVYGVPEIAALPDGRLLVIEREANIPPKYLGSTVTCRLFLVDPRGAQDVTECADLRTLPDSAFLEKRLLCDMPSDFTLFRHGFANYEGMCPGLRLSDGRQTLLLVADSEGGYGKGPFRLKDFIRAVVLSD